MPIHPIRMANYQGISHPGELRGLNRSAITEAGRYPNRMDVLTQSGTDAGVEKKKKK